MVTKEQKIKLREELDKINDCDINSPEAEAWIAKVYKILYPEKFTHGETLFFDRKNGEVILKKTVFH